MVVSTAGELLAVRMGRAHIRFIEDTTFALRESSPEKADIERALQDQVSHGKRLLEMAEAACRWQASSAGLLPAIHKEVIWALTVSLKDFRDVQELVGSWTAMHGALEGEPALSALVTELSDLHAELVSEGESPAFDVQLIRQAREAYDRGDFQELREVIRDLQGPSPRAH